MILKNYSNFLYVTVYINRIGSMPLESNVPQEFIQEHIMKMLQYHFRICNHHAEDYELLKSEVEVLKSKASAQQVQKINFKKQNHACTFPLGWRSPCICYYNSIMISSFR
jgi:hypothetical protein